MTEPTSFDQLGAAALASSASSASASASASSGAVSLVTHCSNSTATGVGEQLLNCTAVVDNEMELYAPSPGIIILLSLCYGCISLGAVFGNGLVIYMFLTSRRMKNVTNLFISNLAASDVVIGMFSIPFQFQAALLQRWNLPDIMCAVCPFFQNVSVNISIFTLIAIAIDRYGAIIHPLKKKATTSKEATIRILIIWFVSLLLAIPQLIAFRVVLIEENTPQCIPANISPEKLKWYMFALCFVQYFFPLCIISFVYTRIGLKLWGRRTPGEAEKRRDAALIRTKKKAIKVLVFVVFFFSLCWLPLQTYQVLSVIMPSINEFKYINIVWFFCHWLAMSNSTVNPFIYFFCHDTFKREFQSKFKWCYRKLAIKGRLQRQDSFTRRTSIRRSCVTTHSLDDHDQRITLTTTTTTTNNNTHGQDILAMASVNVGGGKNGNPGGGGGGGGGGGAKDRQGHLRRAATTRM